MANRNDFFFKAGPQASLINWSVVGVAMVNKSRGSFFFCFFCTRQATTRTLCLNLSIQSKGCSINQINNANKFVPVEGGCFGGVESGWGRLGLAPYGLGRN